MRLIVNQNYPADYVKKVQQDDVKTGLFAGDVLVSPKILEQIKEFLNQKAS